MNHCVVYLVAELSNHDRCTDTRVDSCHVFFFFFQAEDGIRDLTVTGVQTCALPIWTNYARRALGFSHDASGVLHEICGSQFEIILVNSRWFTFPVPSLGISRTYFTSRGTKRFVNPLALMAARISSSCSRDSFVTAISISPLSSSGRLNTAI